MARPLRVEFPGAVYHVMARGNERKATFRDDRDRRSFLKALAEMVERFGVRLHAYCLMPNHYHLVLATPQGNLSRAIGWLQVTYTVRFNHRHSRCGHLFQGRFKAQLVEADEYGQWLVEYVHLNPVRPKRKSEKIRPGQAERLARYEWSSHWDYGGSRRQPRDWLCMDWQRYWGRNRQEARRAYRRRIREAFGREVQTPWEGLRGGLVLGGEELYETARRLTKRKGGQEEIVWTKTEEQSQFQARVRELVKSEMDPRVEVWARVRLGGERAVDVAREKGYATGSAVGQIVGRLERRGAKDRMLHRTLERLQRKVCRVDAAEKPTIPVIPSLRGISGSLRRKKLEIAAHDSGVSQTRLPRKLGMTMFLGFSAESRV